jgi:hypothetical protein
MPLERQHLLSADATTPQDAPMRMRVNGSLRALASAHPCHHVGSEPTDVSAVVALLAREVTQKDQTPKYPAWTAGETCNIV